METKTQASSQIDLLQPLPPPLDTSTDKERNLIIECVRRWGGLNSDAVLDPACLLYKTPLIDGIIGYRDEANCAVVFGDPICAPSDIPSFVTYFHHYCKQQNKKVIYISASESFAKWAINHVCGALIKYGEELFLDPHHDDPRKGAAGSLVRRKVRHALREGTLIHEYLGDDKKLEQEIEQVGISWLENRTGPQIHISNIRLFADRHGKRWFYAQHENRIVGVVLLNELKSRKGWLLNRVMITPNAPHGTPELLVITALEALGHEDYEFVTFGAVPSEQLGEIIGLNTISKWLANQGYKIAKMIFPLNGTKKFWGKFQPHSSPSYLLFSESSIGLREVKGLLRALNLKL